MILWRNVSARDCEWFGTEAEAKAAAKKRPHLFQHRDTRVAQCVDTGANDRESLVRLLNAVATQPTTTRQ